MNSLPKNFFLILTAALFTFLLFLPSTILSSCPKGLTNDPFPGSCSLYTDENQDKICDLSQINAPAVPGRTFNFSFGWQTGIFLTLTIIATILAIKAKSALRLPLLSFSLIFAFFTFKYLCPIAFFQFLLIFKDQAVLNFFPFLIFLSAIILTVVFGRIFCGWVCPIGVSQELVYQLPRWLKLKPPDFTKKVPSFLKFLPLLILAVIGFWVVRSGQSVFCQLDPFSYLFGLSTSQLLLIVLLILFLISFFIFRPFCLFLCPLGAIFSALSSVSIWQIKRNKKTCSSCGICYQRCPVRAINKKFKIDPKSCLRCQQCLIDCPQKALSYQS